MLKMSEKAGDYCSNEPLCVCTCARVCVHSWWQAWRLHLTCQAQMHRLCRSCSIILNGQRAAADDGVSR